MQKLKMTDVQREESACPPGGMTAKEYRTRAKEMVDYIADYLENIRSRRVFPDVQPGYMQQLIPDTAPDRPEPWSRIIQDVERVIMPGVTHWQSPSMHAYFPALNSYPSLLGDMLADAINCLGFTWASSPACTELETIVIDWLGKMIGLPPLFLHSDNKMGGGCIQTTASDCTFVTILAARTDAIQSIKRLQPNLDDSAINGRLIAYCSDQAHSSVEKAGLIGLVKMRFLPSDENLSLRGDTLQEAVLRDRENGLVPFYVCATLGTTGACAFDNLKEIGLVCHSENLWLHVDAAYAGSAFICPEFRRFMAGIEYADSFAFNPSKWLMVHFDCSAMWVKDARALHRTFNVEPLYLQHENSGAAIDYMHWQIALSRRFRSLKLWFVLRAFGVEGLQAHIRKGVNHAIHFENLLLSDRRFIVAAKRYMGMVVFRMDGPNVLTENLLKRLNKQGRIHMVPASLKGVYVIRFTVTSQFTTTEDVERDFQIISDMATKILNEARTDKQESILEKDEDLDEYDGNGRSTHFERDGAPNGFHDPHRKTNDSSKSFRATDDRLIKKGGQLSVDKPPNPSAGSGSSGKPSHSKTAAIKRREYGISLLLSNVPMSPKIVNGSFAAMFDDASASIDLDKLCRQLTVGGDYIRLSPRKRGMLADSDRQMSLDYGVLSASRKQCPERMKLMGSLDSKIDDILELRSSSTVKKNGQTNDFQEGDVFCEQGDGSFGTEKFSGEGQQAPGKVNGGSPRSPRSPRSPCIRVKATGAKETSAASATSGGATKISPVRIRKPMGVKIHMSTEGVDGKEKVDIYAGVSPGGEWDQMDKETSTELSLTAESVGWCPHCGRGERASKRGDGVAV